MQELEKAFDHKKVEPQIYKMWEEGNYFKAARDSKKKPYTILLPPPNASGKMHTGNVLMIAIEDLLIRWKRMQGYAALWVPGTDHAGFETQITYERELKKEGKSRMDFDRNTLYNQIWDFVQKNKGLIEEQIRKMGASVDWSRYTFTLDPHVLELVFNTFKKMEGEGLVYRDDYIVNYCPDLGTTFADLEVDFVERNDPLYYVRYPLVDHDGGASYVVVATVRPEPIFVDTHLAVNPKDPKNNHLVGKKVLNPLTDAVMEIIADDYVDPDFGTGVVKLTPAHDKNDYAVARKHNLPIIAAINLRGRMNENAGKYAGLKVKEARKQVVVDLQQKNLIEKIDEKYLHLVPISYKGEKDIEPLVLPNWFVKVATLKAPALEVVQKGEVKIFPTWRKITYTKWMEEMRDWPISRQVVWGIRIPAWYDVNQKPDLSVTFLTSDGITKNGKVSDLLKDHSFAEIEKGLQGLIAAKASKYVISKEKPGENFLQETDTFDTWFSSGQWPLATLHYPDSEDFKYFYPTQVLETGWEIVKLWVSRMIMFGIYLTGKPPFTEVYLHGIVRALDGKKMSKSLGNIINPDEFQEQYGTDALRMGLISGTANGKDFNFPKDKIVGYRNFANKIWNMARFMLMLFDGKEVPFYSETLQITDEDKDIIQKQQLLIKDVNKNLDKFRFSDAADQIYHFMWDELAAKYIESIKGREDKEIALSVFRYVFLNSLK
ncbi:MAG TPA: valine--tRNA ligase, partial [Candidatus Saccharimonadales bacterium]|nr:valine--tRNA ligase [Candidatus Saccharimonadales bacterium]